MTDSTLLISLLLLFFVILLNGFFASAEVALLSLRTTRLRELAAARSVGAQAALHLRGNPRRLLSMVQVGVTLASLGAGWAGEATVSRLLERHLLGMVPQAGLAVVSFVSFALGFLILTFLMVVLGEVVPKNVAIQYNDRVALLTAPLLQTFDRVASPFVWLLERSASFVSRLLRVREEQRGSYSHEELKAVVEASFSARQISEFEFGLLARVLAVEDMAVREIMVPRNEVVSLPLDAALDRILRTFVESRYSRIPVYEKSTENIIGILTRFDLMKLFERWYSAQQLNRPLGPLNLRRLLREPHYVPESKDVSGMLGYFRDNHVHMAIVVDEFGSVAGLVTLEDVVRQFVGGTQDELDERPLKMARTPDVIELEGSITIREIRWDHGIELPEDPDFETLAGFLLSRFGFIPDAGDAIEFEGRRYTVIDMDKRRIARVRVEQIKPESAPPAGPAAPADAPGSGGVSTD